MIRNGWIGTARPIPSKPTAALSRSRGSSKATKSARIGHQTRHPSWCRSAWMAPHFARVSTEDAKQTRKVKAGSLHESSINMQWELERPQVGQLERLRVMCAWPGLGQNLIQYPSLPSVSSSKLPCGSFKPISKCVHKKSVFFFAGTLFGVGIYGKLLRKPWPILEPHIPWPHCA